MTKAEPPVLAKALQDKLDISSGHASDLANNKRKPSLKLAVRIERAFKIAPRWWIERDGEARP